MDTSHGRISSADRDAASDLLRAGLDEGRLDSAEFDDRIVRLFNDVTTYDELWLVIRDQPGAADLMPTDAAAMPARDAAIPLGAPGVAVSPYPRPGDTNGFAIASLVCGLAFIWTFGLGGILGVVFGHIARRQIRTGDQRGAGLALAGLIIGYTGAAVLVLAVIGFVAEHYYGVTPPVTPGPHGVKV